MLIIIKNNSVYQKSELFLLIVSCRLKESLPYLSRMGEIREYENKESAFNEYVHCDVSVMMYQAQTSL